MSFIGQGPVKKGVPLIAEERLILYSTIRSAKGCKRSRSRRIRRSRFIEGPDATSLEFCLRVHRSFHYDRFEWIALRLTGHQSLFYWFIATRRLEVFPTSISLSTRLTEGSSDQPPPKARYVEKKSAPDRLPCLFSGVRAPKHRVSYKRGAVRHFCTHFDRMSL